MSERRPDMEQWEQWHQHPESRDGLHQRIIDGWARSDEHNIDYHNALPAKVSRREYEQIKEKTKRLLVYGGSVISTINIKDDKEEYGALLFDKTGCLMRIYASDTFFKWAAEHDIRTSTRWSEESIGTNVVSLGLEMDDTIMLTGEKNYARFLTEGRYAYSPIRLENGELLGSVVMASALRSKVENLLQIALTIARAVELQFFWFNSIVWYGNLTDGSGMLTLDQSNNQNRVLVLSEAVKQILGLPDKDYFYDRLETIVDPPPANRRFWDITNNEKIVNDEVLPITINGKEVIISASTNLFRERKFHMHGISFDINSFNRINKLLTLHSGNTARYHFEDIIGESDVMKETIAHAKNLSNTDSNILIQGDSGVGKDIFAQALHNNSSRKDKPFVVLNCAAFSRELIASELFGYESGAFTGAKKEGAIGKFELANQGTLFLDEIGDMPLDLQAILLRVVEEKSFRRVGGNELIHVDVRIISATNQKLKHKIDQRLFREDLYYRLGTVKLTIPPLQEREDDVLLLTNVFAHQICRRLEKPEVRFTAAARAFIKQYSWPGNVRELQNLLEGVISTHNVSVIDDYMIRQFLGDSLNYQGDMGDAAPTERSVTKSDIIYALNMSRNNRTQAAKRLGVSRSTLYRWMEQHGIA